MTEGGAGSSARSGRRRTQGAGRPDEASDVAGPRRDTAREAALDEAMELIHFAFRRVVEEPDALLDRSGMGRLHHRVLYVVGKNPGIRVLELADLLGVSKQALHGPLGDLRRAELVAHVADPGDGRARSLALTSEGRGFERRLAELQHRCFAEAFERAGPDAEARWRVVMDLLGGGRRLRHPSTARDVPVAEDGEGPA